MLQLFSIHLLFHVDKSLAIFFSYVIFKELILYISLWGTVVSNSVYGPGSMILKGRLLRRLDITLKISSPSEISKCFLLTCGGKAVFSSKNMPFYAKEALKINFFFLLQLCNSFNRQLNWVLPIMIGNT